ncbi:SGNH/GDSL hydrolase family protein [Massilia sp. PWRC2]|uniref:SGNH/GDSL hydrolase family protein n=1 Tax=Massilia sp. PWRC2 TaxID=2804626 RepID=UPI003CEFA70F
MATIIALLRAAPRRVALLCCAVFWCALASGTVHAQGSQAWASELWVGSWGAGPAGPPLDTASAVFNQQTVRLIVHTSTAGSRVRIRLSNEMGGSTLQIGGAHVALRVAGSAGIVAGSDRTLTFSGNPTIVVPAGTPVLSDPVDLAVPALSDLAISLYFPVKTRVTTVHAMATQDSYVSTTGNFVGSSTFPVQGTIEQWPFLVEVDVTGKSGAGAIITLGDSITDGLRSNGNSNNRWPDWLARRLQAGSGASLGVVNRGIAGNRLLSNPQVGSLAGRAALERFDRDVLATAGARYLIVLIGINDLINSSSSSPLTSDDLIAGYRQLIARAHARGISVIGATVTPFQDADYYSADKDLVRQAANTWIRSSGQFDGVVDFDALLRDPANPRRLAPSYDSGDHLHPNNLGYQLMGNAVPLSLFTAGVVRTLDEGASVAGKAAVDVTAKLAETGAANLAAGVASNPVGNAAHKSAASAAVDQAAQAAQATASEEESAN